MYVCVCVYSTNFSELNLTNYLIKPNKLITNIPYKWSKKYKKNKNKNTLEQVNNKLKVRI